MAKRKKETDSECTLPPDQPISAASLGEYTLGHDPHEEAEIASYVDGQCRGEEEVHDVELIKTEYVSGQRYDVWDVHTNKQRWWVITNMTNLYPQSQFPSLDYTLSFHIGLMHRMLSRQGRDREPDPFDEVYRRRSDVSDLIERAIEAEEFQASAMQLRECLITLVGVVRRRIDVPSGIAPPKDADVPGWNEVLINCLCAGASNKALRQYMKAVADRTWQLVNWLTHDRNANKTEAIIAAEGVSVLIGHFAWLVIRSSVDLNEICPQCSSRDVHAYYDGSIAPDGAYYNRCKACDWNDHPSFAETAG